MANKFYEFLNLTENATDEMVEERYRELKAKYQEDRFLVGEAGNDAARNLEKLESAYLAILTERREQKSKQEKDSALAEVDKAIRENDYESAQRLLDNFDERGAEWHYFQAVIFYKKEWINESKKQLELAMQMEPDNQKYKETYDKLNEQIDFKQQQKQQEQMYSFAPSQQQQMGGGFCESCSTCLCINCLFNLCCGCN